MVFGGFRTLIGPNFWGEPLRWHNFFGPSFRFCKSVLASSSRRRGEDGYIFRASVLQPAIRVMHQAGLRLSALDGLLQRSDGELHREGTIQRPAHHFAREPVQDHRQVDKFRLAKVVLDPIGPKSKKGVVSKTEEGVWIQ